MLQASVVSKQTIMDITFGPGILKYAENCFLTLFHCDYMLCFRPVEFLLCKYSPHHCSAFKWHWLVISKARCVLAYPQMLSSWCVTSVHSKSSRWARTSRKDKNSVLESQFNSTNTDVFLVKTLQTKTWFEQSFTEKLRQDWAWSHYSTGLRVSE